MQDHTGGVDNTMSGGAAGAVFQAHTLNVNLHLGAPQPAPPAPPRQAEDEAEFPLPDLKRCLAKLGIPADALGIATEWLTEQTLGTGRWEPPPQAARPARSGALRAFASDLRSFTRPDEWFLGSLSYFSVSKIAAIYAAHRHRLGDEEAAVDQFRRLHRYLATQHRLACGPALLLLGEELPYGDGVWLYFTGTFRLRLEPAALQDIPRAQEMIKAGGMSDSLRLANLVFKQPDPFFLPLLEFEGSAGPHEVTMVLSRQHLVWGSATGRVLAKALSGHPVRFSGFGTLHPDQGELRPFALRTVNRR
ncbi:hypothetical protein ACH4SK_28445 [Streptomyces inhibens]|uniref:hypothetical protein n=1 Tax=Streptomyces inhibens TaxID=2293571 RepID=UPI00378C61D6